MAQAERPNETLLERCRVASQYETRAEAAEALGISVSALQRSITVAKEKAARGELGFDPVLPGFETSKISTALDDAGNVLRTYVTQKPERGPQFEVPAGHVIKGISANIGPDGRVTSSWVKTKEGISPQDAAECLKTAFADYARPAAPVPVPDCVFSDAMTLFPLPDLHIGMYAHHAETGKNWDLKIAEREIGGAAERLIALSPTTKKAIILGGGDAMHADNQSNRTANSGNQLDVDGRYDKVLLTTCFLFVRIIDLALHKHETVEVRVLKGNHDEHSSIAIGYFLLAHYRNEPRVHVDVSASLFWFFRYGKTMLAATHGHEAKPEQMPMIMANDRAEDWFRSDYRFAHTFHRHHREKKITEVGGVVVETHQAPVARDSWHHGAGYRSGRSLQKSITYDKNDGEIARSMVSLS